MPLPAKPLPEKELLHRLLQYEPTTGLLYWKERTPDLFEAGDGRYTAEWACNTWNGKFAGKVAGTKTPDGYVSILIFARSYRASRVVWKLVHGVDPKAEIDHKNAIRDDNRISNLREATRSQNTANQARRAKTTAGCKGVCRKGSYIDGSPRYCAQINVERVTKHLGYFRTVETAAKAYAAAARKHHGEFARVS